MPTWYTAPDARALNTLRIAWYKESVPSFQVETGRESYPVIVERGVTERLVNYLPAAGNGRLFVATTKELWQIHGPRITAGLGGRMHEPIFFEGGEAGKRLAGVEAAAEHLMRAGADRSSLLLAFGGGIVGDMGGFLAAIFMRGIPVVQIPTTLLAQVDASIGGKTGVNLTAGKNLIGCFHQPLMVLIDPELLSTLPEREYRAGLYEVIKYGVISSLGLFRLLQTRPEAVLERKPGVLDWVIGESVRIKAEVVSADEREHGLRRILNFGHTVGHALEAETGYSRFLHGEAVAFGMLAATHLAWDLGMLSQQDHDDIVQTIRAYGPIPTAANVDPAQLQNRLVSDKKSVKGTVHFVLPTRIGTVEVKSGISEERVLAAIAMATQ